MTIATKSTFDLKITLTDFIYFQQTQTFPQPQTQHTIIDVLKS